MRSPLWRYLLGELTQRVDLTARNAFRTLLKLFSSVDTSYVFTLESVIRNVNIFLLLLCEKALRESYRNTFVPFQLLFEVFFIIIIPSQQGCIPLFEVPLARQASRYINISLASVKEKENLEIIYFHIRVRKHHIYGEFCKTLDRISRGRNQMKIIANSPKCYRVPFTFFHMKATSIYVAPWKRRHSPSRKLFNRQNIEIE